MSAAADIDQLRADCQELADARRCTVKVWADVSSGDRRSGPRRIVVVNAFTLPPRGRPLRREEKRLAERVNAIYRAYPGAPAIVFQCEPSTEPVEPEPEFEALLADFDMECQRLADLHDCTITVRVRLDHNSRTSSVEALPAGHVRPPRRKRCYTPDGSLPHVAQPVLDRLAALYSDPDEQTLCRPGARSIELSFKPS